MGRSRKVSGLFAWFETYFERHYFREMRFANGKARRPQSLYARTHSQVVDPPSLVKLYIPASISHLHHFHGGSVRR